ncbi:serine protease inhibitor 42Dd-like [Aedes albopictus]|uniref:Serpin domain-containing protein n=1 Tax=Aedes albopictus TaxID=7160 RepID=A0ABM1ZB81_AEDAL
MLIRVISLVWLVAAVAGGDGPDFSFGDVDFSVEYFKAAHNASSNCVVSPLSVRLILAAFYQVAGADVEETLQRAFYLPLEKSVASDNVAEFLDGNAGNTQLQIAFKAFKNQDQLSDVFATTLQKAFKISPENVKFEDRSSVASSVNRWARESTNGRIQQFINEEDLDVNSELLLLNAVALKASWAEKFSVSKTDRQMFAFTNGPRPVDMMHETLEVLYKIDNTYHTIQIPYSEDSDLAMWVLVPRGSGSFDGLLNSLSSGLLDDIETTAMPKVVDISLPRFQIQSYLDAKHVIERMGYRVLFTENDFNVFEGRKSSLSDLRQSTFLTVDEEGTEAAAVSSASTKFRSKNIQFNVNQPFVFIIKKISTDTTVFIGHYSIYQ